MGAWTFDIGYKMADDSETKLYIFYSINLMSKNKKLFSLSKSNEHFKLANIYILHLILLLQGELTYKPNKLIFQTNNQNNTFYIL